MANYRIFVLRESVDENIIASHYLSSKKISRASKTHPTISITKVYNFVIFPTQKSVN
ncbi:MAG: hypothetical protein F6K17_00280 [Okeania sp. SIO3C4]|nr:hypothetical protein [Okeania sp. SIO3C4]